MRRLLVILRVVGPDPGKLVLTCGFLVRRRVRQARLRAWYLRGGATREPRAELRPLATRLSSAPNLPEGLRSAALQLRREADAILHHKFDILGSGLVHLGARIDWHRDFKSGYRWPVIPYRRVEQTRLTDLSDAKVPWELSRSHQLLTLARAAVIFEDERYAREFELQLVSWLEANPAGYGINWRNPMEVAIRAVNWLWAIGTLEEWRPLDAELRCRVTASLIAHARHIAANLEGTPYLRGNHYLADLLGLFAIGSALEGDERVDEYSAFAREELEREIRRQVLPDGASFEGSTAYHGLVLEIFLIARFLAGRVGATLSNHYDEVLVLMLELSRAVRHPNGRIPLFGDQDSGRVLPGAFARRPTHDNLLWLGAAIVGHRRPIPGMPDAEVAWIMGLEAWSHVSALPPPAESTTREFPDAGYYVLRGKDTHAVAACTSVGVRGLGGHSHNDILSYEISIRAQPFIVDSGTYAYTFDITARNAHRSTAAHNAVVVDGQEINPIIPERVFELTRVARAWVEEWIDDGVKTLLVAAHDGYRRLDPPVIHRRTFELDHASGSLTVTDELLGKGRREVRSFVHLAPGTAVDRRSDLDLRLDAGVQSARLAFDNADSIEIDTNGWVSERYGVRAPATVVVGIATRELPTKLSYTLAPAS